MYLQGTCSVTNPPTDPTQITYLLTLFDSRVRRPTSLTETTPTCHVYYIYYIQGVFVYWYGPVWTGTKSIPLLVWLGSDRSIVGLGRDRLLGTGTFLRGSLRNYPTVDPQSGTGTARTVCLLRTGPYQIKMVRTNKRTHS
jgi:hypothetical protein